MADDIVEISEDMKALQAAIDQMTPEERVRIQECIERLDDLVDEYGDLGLIALALVGIMKQIDPEA